MWRACLIMIIAAALLITTGSPALADGLADEAELHFQLGAEHYKKGDLNGALEHFLLSNRLVPNRNVVFNIASTFEGLGRYADAHRYYVDALEGETDQATVAQLNEALGRIAPQVAVLRVISDPPGATIYIDRRDLGSRGRAPRPLALQPGRYKVIVELAGYEPAEQGEIEAPIGQQVAVSLKLKQIVGQVQVDVSGAPDAQVHVDDEAAKPACQAPCELTLVPGSHLLFFSRKGFQAQPRQVVVVAKQKARTVAVMTPLRGAIVVESSEPGAVVEVDDKPMGFTPTVIQNVAVGQRQVRVTMRGFKPLQREVEVKANQQVQLLNLRLEPLREVQAVSRLAEDIDDAPSSLTIIDGPELRAFGYPTIASALHGIRGVSLSNDRGYYSAGIRGIGEPNDYGNRVLVLSDGLSLNDNLLNSSYIGVDGRIDLHDIERIEVVRGPGSLLYGTGAFSGVINLVPRARDNPSGVHVGIGTYDNAALRARGGFQYNFTKDAGIWASVAGSRSDGFDLPVHLIDPGTGPAVQLAEHTERFRAVGTTGRIWYGPLNGQWLYNRRDQYLPVGALATRFNDANTVYTDERVAGEIRFEPKWSEIELLARAHANHYFFGGFYTSERPDPDLTEDYYGTWFGAEARLLYKPLSWLRIIVGGEGQFHIVATMMGTEVENGEPIEGGEYLNEQRPYNFGAPYATLQVEPIDWFKVSGGVRVDIYDFGPIVVPRGALIFKPVTGGVLKLMGGRAFRAPSIYEQYYNDGGYSQVPAVDPARGLELKPESIYSGELEYLQRFAEDWVVIGAGHASYITDIINTVPDETSAGVIRYANAGSAALVAGGEAEIRREWRQGWMLSAFYGYQRAQLLDPDDPRLADNPRFVNSPEHLAGAKGIIPISPDIASVGIRTALEAPRRIDTATDDETELAVITDLTLSGGATKYGLRYIVGVYNLFDWQWDVPVADTYASRTIRQNGRTFMLDLSFSYPP